MLQLLLLLRNRLITLYVVFPKSKANFLLAFLFNVFSKAARTSLVPFLTRTLKFSVFGSNLFTYFTQFMISAYNISLIYDF